MKSYPRSERVSGHIQRILSDILHRDIKDPRLESAIITAVKVSRDLKIARIYFMVTGGEKKRDEATRGFNSALGYVKRTLARELGLRYMPELKFFYDESFDYGSKIDHILKVIATHEENGSDHPTFEE